jgi:hypothetical protein
VPNSGKPEFDGEKEHAAASGICVR